MNSCFKCKQAALVGGGSPLKQIGVSDGPIFLYVCENCGAFWIENLREAHPVTELYARETFPNAFTDASK
jgi:hypothetical protein